MISRETFRLQHVHISQLLDGCLVVAKLLL